jgi:hypothetical protein
MKPIENPLVLAMLGLVCALVGQLGFALAMRDLGALRNLHYWLDDQALKRMASERDYRRISESCFPGPLILLGGLPQALAISLSYTTLVVGLRESWWALLMIPFVYAGAECIFGTAMRRWPRHRLRMRIQRKNHGDQVGPTSPDSSRVHPRIIAAPPSGTPADGTGGV